LYKGPADGRGFGVGFRWRWRRRRLRDARRPLLVRQRRLCGELRPIRSRLRAVRSCPFLQAGRGRLTRSLLLLLRVRAIGG
jgi:hypothetical protein